MAHSKVAPKQSGEKKSLFLSFSNSSLLWQNQEMIVEGDLANTVDQSNKIREMQDKIANLRAQVRSDECRACESTIIRRPRFRIFLPTTTTNFN